MQRKIETSTPTKYTPFEEHPCRVTETVSPPPGISTDGPMTMRVTIVEENTPTRPRFREILNDGCFNNTGLDEGPSAIKCSKFRVSTLFCIFQNNEIWRKRNANRSADRE